MADRARAPRLHNPVIHVAGGIRLESSERRVIVRSGQDILADSHHAIVVQEGHHPLRYYLPPEDVRFDLLESSHQSTYCPYKGSAVYYALTTAADGAGIAWSYPVPLPGMEPLAGLIAFYQERVELDVSPAD